MNWHAVAQALGEDARRLQQEQLEIPVGKVAASAAVGAASIVLARLGLAIERGIRAAESNQPQR